MKLAVCVLLACAGACATQSPAEPTTAVPPARRIVAPAAAKEARAALDAGLARVRGGDAGGAIGDLSRAIELDPTLAAAFNWRGHCLNLLGMPAEALKDYDRAIELQPDYAWSHYARAMANHNLHRYETAIAGYTRSIELDPTFVKAWNWRGFTRKLVGDYAGSADDLRHGLEMQPDDTWALSELAKVEQARGRFDECRAALEQIVRIDPRNGSAHAQLGFLFAVRGDRERSQAELAQACASKAPEETYARIWMQREDRARADAELRAWFDDARIDDPWELQVAAFLLGDGTDDRLVARAGFEMENRVARGAPPDYLACEAAFYAGLRHERAGERDAARKQYALARAQSDPEAWEWTMARVRSDALGR